MQPLRLLLLQLLCTIAGAQMPTFNDEILGELVVSNEQYPFLTPASTLEKVHIYPTDQQLELIKKAAANGGMLQKHGKRRKGRKGRGGSSWIDDAWNWFIKNRETLGEFLKIEFSTEINSTVVDPGDLPFDQINSDTYFKAMVFDRDQFVPYLEEYFNPLMRNLAAHAKDWLPAESIIGTVGTCAYSDYDREVDADFKYNKNDGGLMVEYKVICKRVGGKVYLVISLYGNTFTLKDIEYVEMIYREWHFLIFSGHSTEVKHWFEKRYITPKQYETLKGFIMNDAGKVIKQEYSKYVDAANFEPDVFRFIALGMLLVLVPLVIGVAGCSIFKCCRRLKTGESTTDLVNQEDSQERG